MLSNRKILLFIGVTMNPIKEEPENMLLRMDWNGNLINSYQFVDNVSGQFYIDESIQKIYIIRNYWKEDRGEVFDIVSYNLL